MKVKHATQVLGTSVCGALLALVYAYELPKEVMATAYFCDRMGKLFDCLNSSQPKKTGQKLNYSMQEGQLELVNFLHQQISCITAWKF